MDDLVFGEPAALHLWSFQLGQSLPQTGLGAGGNVNQGYTDAEARVNLTAALGDPSNPGGRTDDNKRAIRWSPWMCAFTGTRITEIMQFRKEYLQFEIVDDQRIPFQRIPDLQIGHPPTSL